MRRRFLSLLLLLSLLTSLALPAHGYDSQEAAADRLYALGLFNGVGTNPDGSPNYALGRSLSRQEAVTMLVRLLGKEQEAKDSALPHPFADVDDWAAPYVGYAYCNGLTNGMSDTTFGGSQPVTATQYLTFVLRAMGYVSGSHFAWDAAWELTDLLDISNGQYHVGNNHDFLRGDAVAVSAAALDAYWADDSGRTLLDVLREQGAVTERPLTPVDRPEPGYQPEVDGQESVSIAMRNFVRDMMHEGASSGEVTRAKQPHRLKETKGWYSYYGDAFDSEEDALLNAFCAYLKECVDGDYERIKDIEYHRHPKPEQYEDLYDPLYSPEENSNVYAFIHADADGIITAYGIYCEGDPDGYQLTFCQMDSTQLVERLREAYMNAGAHIPQVTCQALREENMLYYNFLNIPENAVWMCLPSIYSTKSNAIDREYTVNVQRLMQHNFRSLLAGTDRLVPAQSACSDKISDSKSHYQVCLFFDAVYNPVAYSLVDIPAN